MRSTSTVFRFSTASLPEKHRVEIWREEFGKTHLNAEFDPLPGVPFACSAAVRCLPGLSILTAEAGGIRVSRTPPLIADGNDDLLLNIMAKGSVHTWHMGREIVRGPGAAILISVSDTGTAVFPRPVKYLSLSLPRAALGMLMADPEAAIMKPIPNDNQPLRLLETYLLALDRLADTLPRPALAHAAAGHILDLAALALGATRDGAMMARERGVRAARLCAIKIDIANNLSSPNLSVTDIAVRHGVSPRYVQALFEAEGTTFSEFVLSQRLAFALRRLVNRRFADRTVANIFSEAGLGASSHFRRAFRRRYGATPSEVRSEALDTDGEPL